MNMGYGIKMDEVFHLQNCVIAFRSPLHFSCLAWGLRPTAAFSLLFLSSISFISVSLTVLISSVFCGVCGLVYRNATLSLACVFFCVFFTLNRQKEALSPQDTASH